MMNSKEKQAAYKKIYMDAIYNEVWKDKKMLDFINKKVVRIVELSNGGLIAINKPTINKHFCFGYSDTLDNSEYKEALDMAYHARTSEEYFINENLKEFDRFCKSLDNDNYIVCSRVCYINSPSDSKIHSIEFYDKFKWKYEATKETKNKFYVLNWQDINALREAYAIEREIFVKRLKTYLKRYGLSQVKSWSYWRDE